MDLEKQIDSYLMEKINEFWVNVPYGKHLLDNDQPLNKNYYIRHRIETIKRIRLTSKMDSIALSKIIDQHYDSARKWGLYTIQEMNHDNMFIKDLNQHGVKNEYIDSIDAFQSTKSMVNYLIEKINDSNSGLPAVCYSLFVEWNADKFSKNVVNRISSEYSDKYVSGARRHIEFDNQHDHYSIILKLAEKLTQTREQIFLFLDKINDFFCQYFVELHRETVLTNSFVVQFNR